MNNLKNAINLLEAVRSTMDSISISGIENQDRFVGCANAIQNVKKTLTEYAQNASAQAEAQKESEVAEDGR